MYIHVGNMDVHSCRKHGCTFMSGTWMYNMDVDSCREYGCTFMLGRWMYIHVGNMDVHSCRENVCKKEKMNAVLCASDTMTACSVVCTIVC